MFTVFHPYTIIPKKLLTMYFVVFMLFSFWFMSNVSKHNRKQYNSGYYDQGKLYVCHDFKICNVNEVKKL